MKTTDRARNGAIPALVSVGLALGVAAIGGLATRSSVGTWYAGLEKPWFNPPNWLFGPVWTALYVLMGLAAWRVWRAAPAGPVRRRALALYGVQLALNLAWSVVFFGLRQLGWALADIAMLLAAIVATVVAFWLIDRPAAAMLGPYLAWVGFASALNLEIWRLN